MISLQLAIMISMVSVSLSPSPDDFKKIAEYTVMITAERRTTIN